MAKSLIRHPAFINN